MRHRKAGIKLNRTSSHRNAMFRNMVTSLFKYDRIQTTGTKAKELRRWADYLVTLAKRGDLHARRQALAIVREKEVVHKLFENAAERFGAISGGYTRVVKVGRRPGDAAPVSIIELVVSQDAPKKKTKKKKTKPKAAPQKAAEDKKAAAEKKTEKAEEKKPSKTAKAKSAAAEKQAQDVAGEAGDAKAKKPAAKKPAKKKTATKKADKADKKDADTTQDAAGVKAGEAAPEAKAEKPAAAKKKAASDSAEKKDEE